MTLILGVDPGAATGLVLADLPKYPLLDGGRIVSHSVVHRPKRSKKNATEAARDAAFLAALESAVADSVSIAVVERPADQTGFGKLQARGTAFSLGASYALALAALLVHADKIVTYPVLDFHGEPGWMQGQGLFARRRDETLLVANALTRMLGEPADTPTWTDHELMALGLIAFHCQREAASTPRTIGRSA